MIIIQLKGYLTYRNTFPEQRLELPGSCVTLRQLLHQLILETPEPALSQLSNQTAADRRASVSVLVNGCHYTHLAQGLETLLKEGDQVAIFPPIAGG